MHDTVISNVTGLYISDHGLTHDFISEEAGSYSAAPKAPRSRRRKRWAGNREGVPYQADYMESGEGRELPHLGLGCKTNLVHSSGPGGRWSTTAFVFCILLSFEMYVVF